MMSKKKAGAIEERSNQWIMNRELFDLMSQGVVFHEETGKIVYANPAASRILGLSTDQLMGLESTDSRWHSIHRDGSPFPAEEHPNMIVHRTGLEVRGAVMGVYNYERDSYRWIEIDAFPIRNGRGRHRPWVYVVFSDISERMEAEDALRNSEEKYRLIFEYSPLGVLYFDENGIIVACNDRFVDIIGSCREKLVGLPMLKLPDQKLVAAVQNALSGSVGIYEDIYQSVTSTKKTPVRAIFASAVKEGVKKGGIGIIEDITERKKAEEALKESETRLRTVSNNLPLGMVYQIDTGIDGKARRFTYLSAGVEQLHGITAARAIEDSRVIYSQVLEQDRPRLMAAESDALAEMKPFKVEIRNRMPDGRILWRLLSSAPRKTVTGHLMWDGIEIDITDRKRAELLSHDIIDNNPLSIQIVDRNGYTLQVNKAHSRLFGAVPPSDYSVFQDNQIKRLGLSDLMTRARKGDVVTFPEFQYNVNLVNPKFPFAPVWIRMVMFPLLDEFGEIERYVLMHEDVTDRKTAQDALLENQGFLASVIENSGTLIYVKDTEGVYQLVNRKWEEITGISRRRAIGSTDDQLFSEASANCFQQNDREVLEKGTVLEREEIFVKKGKTRFFLSIKFPLFSHEGVSTGICGMSSEITERKEAEDALRISENRFRELVELAVDGILMGDDKGIIIGANQAFCKIIGLSSRDILGKHLSELPYTPDSRQTAPFRFDLIEQGQVVENQRTLRRPDGREVHVEMRSKKMPDGSYQTIFRDITERRRSETALHESTELFSLFMRHSPIYTYIKEVTPTESRAVQVSENFVDMLGIQASDMIGKTMDELFPAEFAAKITADDWDVVKSGKVLRKDEELNGRFYTSFKYPIEMGGRTLLAGYTIDITERKQAEEEHVRLSDQLMQAQKMESVGRLAGGVAHDFNNMLGVIMGYTDMGLAKLEADHPLKKNLQEIRKAAERSANLTRQLLAFARKQTISPRVLDLNATVEGMLKMLERLIGEDIELVWLPCKELLPIRVDPSQVDQILANLCVNARDAVTEKGRIIIETDNSRFDAVNTSLNPEAQVGDYVRLTVSDNGCGLDSEAQAHLFEPFYTTKENGKGTGLGLATVYGIVKQNNGFISVYSEPGQGTSFKVYFPSFRESIVHSVEADQAPPRQQRQGTILLVEDEPAILDMTTQILEELGYRVLAAANPGQAQEIAQNQSGHIDLLITDVVMPEMNGRDLAAILLGIHPELRLLFMSGYTEEIIAHHGVLDSGVCFIQKPFTIDELSEKVAEVLDGE